MFDDARPMAAAADGARAPAARRLVPVARRGLIGAGLALALGGMGAGGAAFAYTNAATDAGLRFFRTLAQQGPAAAYAETAPDLRTTMSEQAFADMVRRAGLPGFTCVRWSVRAVAFSAADLTATLTLRGDRRTVAAMTILRDAAGVWRVAALQVPAPQ